MEAIKTISDVAALSTISDYSSLLIQVIQNIFALGISLTYISQFVTHLLYLNYKALIIFYQLITQILFSEIPKLPDGCMQPDLVRP